MRKDSVGLPLLRPSYVKTPCMTCPKIPELIRKDNDPRTLSREHAIEWTERSKLIYEHFKECEAVNDWPRNEDGSVDPIVKRHARLLREFEAQMERAEQTGQIEALTAVLGLIKRKQHG